MLGAVWSEDYGLWVCQCEWRGRRITTLGRTSREATAHLNTLKKMIIDYNKDPNDPNPSRSRPVATMSTIEAYQNATERIERSDSQWAREMAYQWRDEIEYPTDRRLR